MNRKPKPFATKARKLADLIRLAISWVTLLFFLPLIMFTAYHLFIAFSVWKVVCGCIALFFFSGINKDV